MTLQKFIKPWVGSAFRHLPDASAIDVYDFSYCAMATENRWNVFGEPTLYLGGDKQVVIGEFSRHFQENRSQSLAGKIHCRRIWRFSVKLGRTLDLRDPEVCKALSLPNAPTCFKDKQVARSTAAFVRHTFQVEAILVPSMVFLDNLSKWCLALFLDNLPADIHRVLPKVQAHGRFEIHE